MKKQIHLVAATILAAAPSYADAHLYKSDTNCEVKIGAEVYLQGGTRIQNNQNTNVSKNNDDIAFDSSAAAHLSVSNRSFNDWVYGLQLGLRATNLSEDKAGSHYLDRTYLWLEKDNYGRVEIGSTVSASSSMQTNGTSIAVAAGGADGAWSKYAQADTISTSGSDEVKSSNFITSTGLLFKETNFEDSNGHERSRKVTYYTPKHHGFQFGVSYIPDLANNGGYVTMPNASTANRQEKNAMAFGVTWEKTIDPKQEVKLALIGEYAKSTRSPKDVEFSRTYTKAKAIEFGGTYKYDAITVGASYGTHWKSNTQRISASIPNAFFYTAGVKYDVTKDLRTSVTYFHGEKFKNPADVVGFGVEYNLTPGFLPYLDIIHFDMKQKFHYDSKAVDADGQSSLASSNFRNKGTALIFGTKVSF